MGIQFITFHGTKMNKITKFGIKTRDNDFHETFRVMLPIIADSIFFNRHSQISKTELFTILDSSVYIFYKITQSVLINFYDSDEEEKASIKSLIEEDRIFIDDDLDKEIKRLGSNLNGDFFCCYLPIQTKIPGHHTLIPSTFFVH
jgi:hypothetical protein